MLMGVMGHIDDGDAYPIVRRLLDGLPTGSYLVLQDGVNATETFHEAQQGYDDTGAIRTGCAGRPRSPRSSSASTWSSRG